MKQIAKYGVKLGQLLIRKGYLTEEQLEAGLQEQKKSKEPLGEILLRLGYLTDKMLFEALSEQFGTSYVRLRDLSITPAVINEIPVRLACHYNMVPIEANDRAITIALSKPLNIHHLDDIKLMLNKDIKIVLAKEEEIVEAIKKYYGVGADTIERMPTNGASPKLVSVQAQETQDIVQPTEDVSIIKFVNQILLEGHKERATDIHIEPYENEIHVRYRVDGVLYETKVPSALKSFQQAVISRIKIMANLNISETRLPQDGRIKVKITDRELDLRVSILPTPFGESVVIRLLPTDVLYDIGNLGLSKEDQWVLENLIQKPHGIIFVTGPTGSGKTTTLYASLNKINTKDRKIITVEDPIEYQLKGVTQVQVHPKINLTFAQTLRSMLRHDPDVMMVGEVRDFETAEITIRAALTGHLVFSTLHTNDAAGGITRLVDMGVEPYLVASAVECFIAQRLVRVICEHCKVAYVPEPEVFKQFDVPASERSKVKLYKGEGCDSCKHTGFRGRTAIYEILLVTPAIKELILKRASSDQIKKRAIQAGMRTLRQDGWERVRIGATTISEVLRVTQIDDEDEVR